jgi:phosphatidylinositol-3,4,5-trisphosphate 3-phosphatase/dual-specificity protein phosphatase PTEN
MNWLRKIVSGKRRRFQDDNYNLDITYITGRVLAMSFPAQGIEKFYRNSIENVNFYTSIKMALLYHIIIYIGRRISYGKTWKKLPSF